MCSANVASMSSKFLAGRQKLWTLTGVTKLFVWVPLVLSLNGRLAVGMQRTMSGVINIRCSESVELKGSVSSKGERKRRILGWRGVSFRQ
jgi:hypothetical protein